MVAAMLAGDIDAITNPHSQDRIPPQVPWIADNGCFATGYPGRPKWWLWLKYHPRLSTCRFATAPDVVGDATLTLRRSLFMLPKIRSLGIPAAFVAQDGLEDLDVPWDEFDVLFIGGTTDWKLGPHAVVLAGQAHEHGKSVHMGRVNSYRRLQHAHRLGCDTVDGTFVAFGPNRRLPELIGWMTRIQSE